MAALLSQEEALRQLRLEAATTTTDQLADVMDKVLQASAIVEDYLKRPTPYVSPLIFPTPPAPPTPARDPTPWDDTTAPYHVKAAVGLILTSLFDGRTPDDSILSQTVMDLLHRLRDPALA